MVTLRHFKNYDKFQDFHLEDFYNMIDEENITISKKIPIPTFMLKYFFLKGRRFNLRIQVLFK